MNDLEQTAIERLKAASEMSLMAYQQPLVICISGGKDSGVITELAIRAGIPCEFQHNHTTADAPETVRFVRSEFKRLEGKGYKCTVNMPTYKGRRTLCSLECQAEFNRQSAKAAHDKAKAAKAAQEKPLRRCAICGEPLPSNMRKYCTPECAHLGAMKSERECKKRRAERMKNCEKL